MEGKKKDIEKFKENVRQYDQRSEPGDGPEGEIARPPVSPEEGKVRIQPPNDLDQSP